MSAEALGWVIRHSPYEGAAFSIHCMIGDTVNDQNHNEFWMSQGTLAKKSRCSVRRVADVLQMMQNDGYLTLLEAREGRPNLYRFEYPQAEPSWDSRVRSECRPPLQSVQGTSATSADKLKKNSKEQGGMQPVQRSGRRFLPGTGWVDAV